MADRIYLDWNATAPLRREARDAMVAAMDVMGNPSSVHGEGRAAKAIVERARAQVAYAFGAVGADIVFTSGATEAAAMACAGHTVRCALTCHDAVWAHQSDETPTLFAYPGAESETGLMRDEGAGGLPVLLDAAQVFGKVPFAFNWSGSDMAMVSAHKLGGPKGVGALVMTRGTDVTPLIAGGGQEMGRRSGTENVIGIAGFGAAAAAAKRDLEAGLWDEVAKLRIILEEGIAAASDQTIFVGDDRARLPNTTCMITEGWKGESQVMSLDLAGFAISAGSACSSGKVKSSRVLSALGYSEGEARSAVRVSLGPTTTVEEVERFVDAWTMAFRKMRARAA